MLKSDSILIRLKAVLLAALAAGVSHPLARSSIWVGTKQVGLRLCEKSYN